MQNRTSRSGDRVTQRVRKLRSRGFVELGDAVLDHLGVQLRPRERLFTAHLKEDADVGGVGQAERSKCPMTKTFTYSSSMARPGSELDVTAALWWSTLATWSALVFFALAVLEAVMAAAMLQYVYSSSSAREHHVVNKNRPWCVFLCSLKTNVFAISCLVETLGQQQ